MWMAVATISEKAEPVAHAAPADASRLQPLHRGTVDGPGMMV
jgi:hypothetical protein